MPHVIVKETTVYTLAELKDLPADKKGVKPYDKAIEKITEHANEDRFYIQWLSEDINDWFKEGPGKLDEGECPFDNGSYDEWDYDRRWVNINFDVYLADYMQRNKLIGKNRTLYKWLRETGDYRLAALVGTYLNRHSRCTPLPDDIDADVQSDIDQLWQNPKLKAKLEAQLGVVIGELAYTTKQVLEYVLKWIVADIDYRYSEEFAVEEAEAQEWVFLPSGYMYH